ncbi:MAG: sigma-70 family RNA polymerase sigma factor [Gemmatimonadetes bacterium]|nr:sigma-70 family RNA polymerase sigma factor [Gemmatimonadota bacterium]
MIWKREDGIPDGGRRRKPPPAAAQGGKDGANPSYTGAMQGQQSAPDAGLRVVPSSSSRELPHDFEAWFHDHRPVVYRFVRFRVATREAAEDVTSEVFMKALRSIHRYDPSLASPRTWLLRIARNAVTDHLRALRRRGSLHVSLDHVPDLVAEVPTQEERVVREERLQRLLNGSRLLRRADQEILALRFASGLDNGEIAEHLGISNNAVAVRLHRALKRLKSAVERLESERMQAHD